MTARLCDDAPCYYCGCWLASQHEHDHFPIPKARGGAATVCACINCHSLKDRQPYEAWPADLAYRATRDLLAAFPAADADAGLPTVQTWVWVASLGDGTAEQWAAMSFPARLLFAKLRAAYHHRAAYAGSRT